MTMLGPILPIQPLQQSKMSFECLPHPPYSPDLAPSDFYVFGLLKQAMGGKYFRSDEEVQQAVQEWLRSQPKIFFIEASMHFRNAGTLVLHALETTQKNEVVVYLLYLINNEIKNI
jgi:hypothetical protein